MLLKTFRAPIFSCLVAILLGLALVILAAIKTLVYVKATSSSSFSIFSIGFFSVAGIVFPLYVIKPRITLYTDRIEQSGLFGFKSLSTPDILGYKSTYIRGYRGGTYFIELVPISAKLQTILVPKRWTKNDVFSNWLQKLRNLDEVPFASRFTPGP